MATAADILSLIKEKDIEWVDLRFTDPKGKWQHLTMVSGVIDEDMLHEGLTVADTVYNPVESKLIKMAKAHGLAAYGGLGMLLQQAALAEKIWFGTDMPIELIQEKLFS